MHVSLRSGLPAKHCSQNISFDVANNSETLIILYIRDLGLGKQFDISVWSEADYGDCNVPRTLI